MPELLQISREIDTRLQNWSTVTKEPPEDFINEAISEALDDWEDYQDALRISAEVKAGRMKTYTLAEVERHLDELDNRAIFNDISKGVKYIYESIF